ncbi:hypothetical protein [Anaerosinus gibii]|uniref:Uncharacterized protein n=1 Tax=Selenobaculum gibii TaxID=3054208 RepID=A0A9Y2AKN6_9FIRM|nr:hypothetical protein [Selenobaculum gbiensis]WIW71533.1 hypothetical protein P3F81_04295 [Selenobaculum gbiensis]
MQQRMQAIIYDPGFVSFHQDKGIGQKDFKNGKKIAWWELLMLHQILLLMEENSEEVISFFQRIRTT